MTQAGVYGQKLGQRLKLKDARVLITRSLRSSELAVTETRNDAPVRDLSGSMPAEDAYLVGHDDAVIRHLGRSLVEALRRPVEANQLFNQSHFTRVFSTVVGASPGVWRRETQSAANSKTQDRQ